MVWESDAVEAGRLPLSRSGHKCAERPVGRRSIGMHVEPLCEQIAVLQPDPGTP
jgi:hypothetical protein